MTVVNPKSISGINSITTGSGSDNLLTIHTSDASNTERFRIDSTGTTKIVTGIVTTLTATTGIVTNFTANAVNIGIDTGVYGEDLVVTGNTRVTGITTFGDSDNPALMLNIDATSGLPAISIPDSIIHSGDTDTKIRFPAADTVTVETGGVQRLRIDSTGDVRFTGTNLTDSTNKNVNLTVPSYDTDEEDVNIIQVENESSTNQISFGGGTSGLNAATKIRFLTASAANTVTGTERFSIASDGDVTVGTGNLVIGTSGKGIDFSATSDASGKTSELLDDYEEGTWSPVWSDATSGGTTSVSAQMHGDYTKIGRMVTVHFYTWGLPSQGTSNAIILQGLPYTAGEIGEVFGSVQAGYYNDGNTSTYNLGIYVTSGNTYGRLAWNNAGNNDVTAASFSGFIANYTNFTGTITYLVA